MHRICGIIHTDLKPENILVSLSKNELKEINENGCLDIDKLEINNDKNTECKRNQYILNNQKITKRRITVPVSAILILLVLPAVPQTFRRRIRSHSVAVIIGNPHVTPFVQEHIRPRQML